MDPCCNHLEHSIHVHTTCYAGVYGNQRSMSRHVHLTVTASSYTASACGQLYANSLTGGMATSSQGVPDPKLSRSIHQHEQSATPQVHPT
jgi:hypothetical protein